MSDDLTGAPMRANGEHVRELAQAIANQAQALADGQVEVPHAAALLIQSNAETLATWTEER